VPKPEGIVLASVSEAGLRLDIIEMRGLIVVMPRPTDWTNFHSFSPNACLAKSASITSAVAKVYKRLAEEDIPTGCRLVLIGFSQGGYVATRLGMALIAGRQRHQNFSITTFNSAPFADEFAEAQASVGQITTNYRTVVGGSAPNALGYRVGDYVSMLGPLPGATIEVEIQGGPRVLSYGRLHTDPYLLADESERWSVKDISQAAHRNPGLKISRAMQGVWDLSCLSPSDLLVVIGQAMLEDAKAKRESLDPCIVAQLENLAGFAKYKPNSWRWRVLSRVAETAIRHPRTDNLLRMSEVILGHTLRAAAGSARRG
jgi:hypothetical protein